ncbi:DUF6287 domain-containing protein [Streptococcus sp. S784/96/1]|uniref:DUF6287 domain-containing protein n=1 Tax=Streptococcus sp. S784/96/1 TaxID=2653499 RepID=UPI001389A153|nr:DUF6287 domain-containing protein [Streptococcus sp. S784/96/1]
MKISPKATTIVLLTSLFLLGACGKKKSESANNQYTVQSSKVATKKSEKSSSTAKSSSKATEGSPENTLASSFSNAETQATTSQSQIVKPANTSSSIDVDALINDDLTTIVGDWSNDLGETITINPDRQVTSTHRTATLQISPGEARDNCYFSGIGDPTQLVGGAGFIVIPAGVPNPHFGDVTDFDRILIGQSVAADEHPFTRN